MKDQIDRRVLLDRFGKGIEFRQVGILLVPEATQSRDSSPKSRFGLDLEVRLERIEDAQVDVRIDNAGKDILAGDVQFLAGTQRTRTLNRNDLSLRYGDISLKSTLPWPNDGSVSQDDVTSRFGSGLRPKLRWNERIGWIGRRGNRR